MNETPDAADHAVEALPLLAPPALWDALAAEHESRHQHEPAWLAARQAGRAREQRQAQAAATRAAEMAERLQTERARNERARLEQQAAHAHQQAELLQATQELLEHLARIGLEITEQLDIDAVFGRIHGHLQALVDAPHLSIWLLDEAGEALHLRFGVEEGRAMAAASVSLTDARSSLVRCWQARAEMDHAGDGAVAGASSPFNMMPGAARLPAGLFGPLIVRDKALGVMAIQSPRAGAYGERERLVFRAVSAYGAIALDNAAVYAGLDRARRALQASSEAERRAREQAEQAARMKSEFLADISDALRTPLQALQQSLSRLNAPTPANAAVQPAVVQLALQQSREVNLLARELLELARLESGAVAPMPEAFSLADLVQDVLLKMQTRAAEGGCRLQPHVATPLADVVADIAMVERALSTFIAFALQRSPEGCPVELHLQPCGAGVRVRIVDSGPGLSEDAQRELFNRPTDPAGHGEGRGRGLGLDLALAQQMLRLSGSAVQVHSGGAAGAAIAFTLPSAAP